MNWLESKKLVVVHDGNFHPDDVFAVATLDILLKGNIKVIRTRDEDQLHKADFVLDTGHEYQPDQDRFDHHQTGGAGVRDNKIPYSTCGLLWKKYGEKICNSKEIADILDKKLVQTIDADDNGISIYQEVITGLSPITLTDIIYSFRPNWKEGMNFMDKNFFKAVDFAKGVILRSIKIIGDKAQITETIQDFYKNSSDKRLIVIDFIGISRYEIWDALQDFPEPLFIICQDKNNWSVHAMRKKINSFENRKNFPAEWAGLKDVALAKITGVADAVFCHNGLFLAVAKSKEGAMKLAELALNSK
jgi:uncharacterized UPF0160 family protein